MEKEEPPINTVVVGRIDSAKATATSRLIEKCGCINQNFIEKFEKQAQELNEAKVFSASAGTQSSAVTGLDISPPTALGPKITEIPFKNAIIALLQHPASITVYKYVSVTVLSGNVSVLGYEIHPGTRSVEIFSSEKTGLIEIKTEHYQEGVKNEENSLSLKKEIHEISNSKKITDNIIKNLKNYTVAIFVQRIANPINVQLLELYYPCMLNFNLHTNKEKELIIVPKGKGTPIRFALNEEQLAADINSSMKITMDQKKKAPRILVCGPKKAGKSTLLRFLVNKTLSMNFGALYLDTDPGQTEFGLPGTVSLTEITKPITVPPFCHQGKPIKMIFTGSVSPEFIEIYTESVSRLMDLYFKKKKKYSSKALFINTVGWMEGTGLQWFDKIIKAVKPTVLVEIVADEETMFGDREIPEDSQYYQICCSHDRVLPTNLPAPELHHLQVLSHLGKNMSEYFGPMLLNEMTPYRVSWEEIPIYVFPGGCVFPVRMIEAVNQSIVALCSVPEHVILTSNIPEFPMTLKCEPENECLAYGLVIAVDEKEHLLYVVSPLKASEWSKVNAIMKGNVTVPDALILKQEIYNVPLPFTDERDIILSDEDETG